MNYIEFPDLSYVPNPQACTQTPYFSGRLY